MSDWNQDSSADEDGYANAIDELRERLAHAVRDAIDMLADESSGRGGKLVNDCQLRACIALTRLTPLVLGDKSHAAQEPPWAHTPECPRHLDPDEAERMLTELERGSAGNDSDEA